MANELNSARWQAQYAPKNNEVDRYLNSSDIAGGTTYGNGNADSVDRFMLDRQVAPSGMGEYYRAAEDMHDPGKGFWAGLLDKGMAVFDTLAIPQQIGYQLLTGGDWRKAIPSFFAKEEWAKNNIHHEIVLASDVLNVWSDGELDKWYQDDSILGMVGEVAFKTATFAADVFTDPLTYVPMGGAVRLARKTLPAGVQAELAGKVALRTQKPAHAAEGLSRANKFALAAQKKVDDLAAKNAPAEAQAEAQRVNTAAQRNLVTQQANADAVGQFNATAKPGEVVVPKAPMPEGGRQRPLGTPYSQAEQEVAAAQYLKDHKTIRATVLGMEDDVSAHNTVVMGQDNVAQASEGIAQIIIGTHPDAVFIRNPRMSHYYNAANLPPKGVQQSSIDGFLAPQIKSLVKVVERNIQKADDALDDIMFEGDPDVAWATLSPDAKVQLAPWKKQHDIKRKNEKWLDELLGDADNPDVKQRRDPRVPRSLIEDQGAESLLPAGYRRSPLEAKDYLEDQFGAKARRMGGIALYPKSVMPMPPAWFNHVFREPTRVLAEQSPEMRTRMMDGLAQYSFGLNTVRKQTHSIFEEAGILKSGGTKNKIKRMFVHNPKGTVDKEKSTELFNLLNAGWAGIEPTAEKIAKTKKAFDEAYAAASPEMQKAHDDMRALFDSMGLKLDIPKDMMIDGYVPHVRELADNFLDASWTAKGQLPPDFEGLSGGKVHWASLMERRGADFVETDMVKIMDMYTRGYARKLYIEPLNQDLGHMARLLGMADPEKAWLGGYTDDIIKNLNGTPSAISKIASNMIGPDNARLAKSSAGAVAALGYSAALTGNLRYPVMSMLQALNTTSAKYGPLRTLKGLARSMSPEGRMQARAAGIDNEITQIYEGVTSLAGRLRSPATPAIAQVEFNIRGLTYHAALGDELARRNYRHIDEVVEEAERQSIIASAVRETEEANHVFGAIGRPVGFSRVSKTGATVATQFMSFPFKQTETLIGIGMENPGVLLDYMYMAGKLQTAAADGLNIDISEYVGINFIKDIPEVLSGERETIPLKAMSNMHKLLSTIPQMMDGISPVEGREAKDAFFDSVEMMIPGKTGAQQWYRGFNELNDIRQGKSSPVRKARRTDLEALSLVALGRGSYNELKFGELSYEKDQSGFASILSGMNTIEAKIERDVSQATFARKQNIRSVQVKLTEEIWDKVRTGNDRPAEIKALVDQLRALGVNYKDLSAIEDRETKIGYAANMSVKMRDGLGTPTEQALKDQTRTNVESRIR
jgi:hypothetical protein